MYNFAHKPTIGDLSKVIALLVQDNAQEGSVNVKTAFVVSNEAEFPEFIHEEIDSGARNVSTTLRHMTAEFSEFFLVSGMVC